MGNILCFAGATGLTPSPSKSTIRNISTESQKSRMGVMDALAESRMTDKEIELCNQVARDVEANRQRMRIAHRAVQLSSHDCGKGSTPSNTVASLTMPNRSSDQVEDWFGDVVIGDSSTNFSFQATQLKDESAPRHSVTPPVLTPDSGVGMGLNDRKSWEVNPKLVYIHQPVQYWRGRFSTTCDRLRSEDFSIQSSNFAATAASTGANSTSFLPKIDHSDAFELSDAYRNRKALEQLRSFCRTADASDSFEIFEQEILANLEREAVSDRRGRFYARLAESKPAPLAADYRPRGLGLDNNIAAATMNIINAAPPPQTSMTRSKPQGSVNNSRKASVGGSTGKDGKVGWRRPSYLKAQQEVWAGETALGTERRAAAAAAAAAAATQSNTKRAGARISFGGPSNGAFPIGSTMPAPAPATKPKMRHSLPRKSSGPKAGSGSNAETLKRVFSGSVRGLRRMGRSFTGMSDLADG